jgi:hypothetical protein
VFLRDYRKERYSQRLCLEAYGYAVFPPFVDRLRRKQRPRISQAIYPECREDPHHPAWFPARQLGAPREWSSRYVAVETQNDQRVAYATLWVLRPRRFRFDLAVRPEWQEQGIGTKISSK